MIAWYSLLTDVLSGTSTQAQGRERLPPFSPCRIFYVSVFILLFICQKSKALAEFPVGALLTTNS